MKLFPNNEAIKWFATQGKKGKAPANLSKGFLTSVSSLSATVGI